ncbi:MAG TPA: hypothetical protein VMU16_02180 [Candidatus Binataceae bacterium]|nr:hypothetical protein [Candidatus Binataceae bacterium]
MKVSKVQTAAILATIALAMPVPAHAFSDFQLQRQMQVFCANNPYASPCATVNSNPSTQPNQGPPSGSAGQPAFRAAAPPAWGIPAGQTPAWSIPAGQVPAWSQQQ